MDTTEYRVWRDTDKKYPASEKMLDAIESYERYAQKPANVILMNPEDAKAIRETPEKHFPDGFHERGIEIRERTDVQRHHYYVGAA